MRRILWLLTLPLLVSCFDLAPASSTTGSGEPDASTTDPPPEDDPGATGEPKSFEVTAGDGVTVEGTISYKGSKSGKIRIDVLGQKDKQMFELLKPLGLEEYGDWSFEAPKNFGEVRVVGFLDITGDGPSEDDAAFVWPELVDIGDEPITGIDLVLADDADLAALTPGAAAGGGGAPPPQPDGEDQPKGDDQPDGSDQPGGDEKPADGGGKGPADKADKGGEQ